MVRLKEKQVLDVLNGGFISIPHGTIKRRTERITDPKIYVFQFHMVRLKGRLR